VQAKRLEGISDLRDESDRDGIRVVVELKRDAVPQVVLNQLYKLTPMQTSFGIILLAIVDNQPRIFTSRRSSTTSSTIGRRSWSAHPLRPGAGGSAPTSSRAW
jgi:hypothetical protein